MRRGRRDQKHLNVGDTVDCWRVEIIKPGERLRLVAEMKLPGRAWLDFEIQPDGDGARLQQTASSANARQSPRVRQCRGWKLLIFKI